METLKLANAVISIDVHGSLKIEKHNGEQIAVELFPEEMRKIAHLLNSVADIGGGG